MDRVKAGLLEISRLGVDFKITTGRGKAERDRDLAGRQVRARDEPAVEARDLLAQVPLQAPRRVSIMRWLMQGSP